MKTGSIHNFCSGNPIEVKAVVHPTCGPLVIIDQHSGSCHFQHDMTRIQARELVEAIIKADFELERLEVAESTPIAGESE